MTVPGTFADCHALRQDQDVEALHGFERYEYALQFAFT